MTKSSQLWGLLGLVLLGICQVSCHAPSAGAGKPGSVDGSSGTGTPGDTRGNSQNTGGAASATGGDGSGNETGMPTDAGMSANSGSASGGASSSVNPDVLAGTCPAGFVACYGVCMEAALMGADCKPALCAAPPAGTTPPSRSGGISARGFSWNVANDGSATTVTFKPGPAGGGLSPTIGAAINYRVNGSAAMQTATLAGPSGGPFTWTSAEIKKGDELDFYFHQTVAVQTIITGGGAPPPTTPLIDTMWFHQTVGQAADPEPAYPLTVKLAGRFRDRHPNEERFDHYVDTYFDGPIFSLTLIDHGDSFDVTVVPLDTHVYGVDFKYYECFGAGMSGALPSPTPLCFTPPELAAVGVRINPTGATATSSGTYTTSVTKLSYGQLVDFELTFVRQPGPMNNRTYYTEFFEYYVGSGRLQPKVQHPWAHAAGDQSITDVTVDQFGYAQHLPNITLPELNDFIAGKVLFEADFETKLGFNPPTEFDCPRGQTPGTKVPPLNTTPPPSPMFTAGNSFTNIALASVARPNFTASACFSCHHLDGKGQPAGDTVTLFPDGNHPAGMGATLLKLFSGSGDKANESQDPVYGTVLDQQAPPGGTPEVKASVTWQDVPGNFGDGTPYTLRKPVLNLSNLRDGALAASTHVSMRIPRPVFGMGLLEAIPAESILANADPGDANHDGISGRPNTVTDTATGKDILGRFGWKAATGSVRQAAALAAVNDVGLTSPLYPKHVCGPMQASCLSAVNDTTPQLSNTDLDHIQSYMRGLSVPPRRNYDDPAAAQGRQVFAGIGCIKCHVANFVTSSSYPIAEMRNIDIQPFTDLLLHDMGAGLADDIAVEEGTATGSEWRTCPLWGNGTGASVMYPTIDAFNPNGNPPPGGTYLHDGRARSITEAILWHGGEAQASHDAFVALPATLRTALLAYVAYPFADPVPLRHCAATSAP
jgi:CxxC motif-containing protein (DUF1111 family)